MSIIRLTPDNFEYFSLITNPSKTYISSSNGITGSVNLFARRSGTEKELKEPKEYNRAHFKDFDVDTYRIVAKKVIRDSIVSGTYGNFNPALSVFLRLINSQSISAVKSQSLDITRFVPDDKIEPNFLKFQVFKDILFEKHRPANYLNYAFTNYHSLNFFTASSVPEGTCLLYPNSASEANATYASGSYAIDGAFSFDFYINPRYVQTQANVPFKAGTIIHLSSSYAVSLITGSLKDPNGFPDGFRLMLQLSHSADNAPSKMRISTVGNIPNDLTFLSNDNSLRRNHWHHCSIRWGGKNINNGTGSFIIDNVEQGTFVATSSIRPRAYTGLQGNPSALVVGNYYEGRNRGNDKQILFFGSVPATRDGVVQMHANSTRIEPNIFRFDHPLNAEIHDLKIYNTFRSDNEIYSSSLGGSASTDKMIFFLPPFFVKESPHRKASGVAGGIMGSPFQSKNGETATPTNVDLSFRLGVRDINLENFTREFVQGIYPRLFNLTSSIITTSANALTLSASAFMYATGTFIKRNLSLLPCDNGKFIPNFDILQSGSTRNKPKQGSPTERFTNDFGNLDLSLVSLRNLINSGSFPDKSVAQKTLTVNGHFFRSSELPAGDLRNELIQPQGAPGKYATRLGQFMAVHFETRDEDSRELVLFDISNIFYGERIEPGTLKITDANLSGSNGQIKITIKDDGRGKLYRSDCKTPGAEFNCIGAVFYDEGIVGIFNPTLNFFGTNEFTFEFKGKQKLHTQTISVLANSGMINSSSSPSYHQGMSASLDANATPEKYAIISDLLFMDENLNVIAKSSLAQPIVKKSSDRILFRIKNDF